MVDELLLTDGQRLLRRILECPEDDAPRLIYSDWLEEQGEEERAKFIRCSIAKPAQPLLAESFNAWNKWLTESFWRHVVDEGFTWGNIKWDRGFISSVRLTCEAFVGGPCTHCHGARSCNQCGGTGRIEGVAMELFERHPITDVKLVDKNPHPPGYSLGWRREFIGPDSVPKEIYDLIDGWRRIHPGPPIQWKEYFTVTDANAALSRACVAYGRSLVGLPMLEGE